MPQSCALIRSPPSHLYSMPSKLVVLAFVGLATAISDGTYALQNARSKSYLNEDISGGIHGAGDNVQVWSDDLAMESHWNVQKLSDGTFAVQNARSMNFLNEDVNSGSGAGNNVQVWTDDLAPESRWSFYPEGGQYQIKNQLGHYLNQDTTSERNVIVWTDGLAPESHWILISVSGNQSLVV